MEDEGELGPSLIFHLPSPLQLKKKAAIPKDRG
jgi:hypothetical protein